ncbi:hypothetical protein K435DRAFT_960898 [Dendrothele bispora CBS 962.96]|uniref:Uncharacterized protein n=1 Tax=Dendrothele bispora (strain CBS 962.96) TaxID=1314807 RepID=A0A4S8MRU5_DENBC|nr:hypothetical protein K435DRAFT_960898 [Dendrothele bispora CBS 962.96]
MSANKPPLPPPPSSGTHFFNGTSHSQFDGMTLNNVGRNQTHDHRGSSSDNIHNDSRSFGTIHGGYTENDNRQMRRNIESVQTYHENQGSHGNSTRNTYSEETRVTTTTQHLPSRSSNPIAQPDRPRENENPSALRQGPYAIGRDFSQSAIRQDREAALQGLPQDFRRVFTECFVPAIIELTGTLRAWADPPPDQIRAVWHKVMPQDLQSNMSDSRWGPMIQKAILQSLDNWRNAFAGAAIEAVRDAINRVIQEGGNPRKYIDWLREGDYRFRRYYFTEVSEDQRGQPIRKGPFQSELISRTFSEHLKVINSVRPEHRLGRGRATGAIVLSILAIERALSFYSSGALEIPAGQESEFSRTNWDDQTIMSQGRAHTIRTTSEIQSLFGRNRDGTDRVSAERWNEIEEKAKEYMYASPSNQMLESVDEDEVDEDFSYD